MNTSEATNINRPSANIRKASNSQQLLLHSIIALSRVSLTDNVAQTSNYRMNFFQFSISDLKMKKYLKAISDCDECLSIEPDNVKAMIRRADALNATGLGNDAYRQYSRALELDPENSIARKNMKNIPIR